MSIYRYTFADRELVPGIALFLSCEAVRAACGDLAPLAGGTGADQVHLANGDRYAVVLERVGDQVWLVPLFGGDAWYRLPLTEKIGHPSWCDHPSFYDPRQVWRVALTSAIAAAARAGDQSTPFARNRASPGALEDMRTAIWQRLAA